MSKPTVSVDTRKRVRLKPEVRSRLILEAALVEFGARGFSATRIEDIARRAGLSKSGVYAHYAGKEEIFEALLNLTLAPLDIRQAAEAIGDMRMQVDFYDQPPALS